MLDQLGNMDMCWTGLGLNSKFFGKLDRSRTSQISPGQVKRFCNEAGPIGDKLDQLRNINRFSKKVRPIGEILDRSRKR